MIHDNEETNSRTLLKVNLMTIVQMCVFRTAQRGHLPKKQELLLTYTYQILLKPTLIVSNECLLNETHLQSNVYWTVHHCNS